MKYVHSIRIPADVRFQIETDSPDVHFEDVEKFLAAHISFDGAGLDGPVVDGHRAELFVRTTEDGNWDGIYKAFDSEPVDDSTTYCENCKNEEE